LSFHINTKINDINIAGPARAYLENYEFIARLLLGLYKNTYKLRSWLKNAVSPRMPTSCGVVTRTFC
jgi:hypothetical protein